MHAVGALGKELPLAAPAIQERTARTSMGFARFLETCKAAETLLLLAAGQDTAAAHTIACHILTTANYR